ncbi:MCE family protein [Nocardia sp. NPDC087230]|uniref:MCE family protein n=1 Tax=Nocardia sp. NPDC087230 TaxID=3364331 RepID=UPI00381A5BC7
MYGISKSFLERDPVRLGLVGTLVIAAALALGFNSQSIPGITGGTTYRAHFRDASGLLEGSEVRVGGVVVGQVQSIDLAGDKVEVEFDADPGEVRLGVDTRATIKVGTVLGHRYVELTPGTGRETLTSDDTIPLEQTASGYDITRSLEETSDTVARTDTGNLSGALDQISAVERELPPDLQWQLTGVERLSQTVAGRDQELRDLLAHAAGVSDVLASRNAQVIALLGQGRSLFAALNNRSAALHGILVQAQIVSNELRALEQDNRNTLGPTLAQLDTLVSTLNGNVGNINAALTGLERYTERLGDVVGSGPFFSALLQNILPANLAGQLPGSLGGPR